MATRRAQGERGLPSINQARIERKRAIVLGRAKVKGMAPQFWLWAVVVLSAVLVIYWRYAAGELESGKNRVMAKQRAVAQALGARLIPFRDRVEEWTMELGKGKYAGDRISSSVVLHDLASSAGLYLRLPQAATGSREKIRGAAADSLRDGFTSCLFISKAGRSELAPKACKVSADCPVGQLCNEYGQCQYPTQPYNMRLLYRALRVLSSDWTDELHEATSDLGVSAYERDLESTSRTDVPVAIEVLQRAKYFTLVLDEKPAAGLPDPLPESDESEAERLQRVAHYARIGVWDLESNQQVLRLRAAASGELRPMGGQVVRDVANRAAQQRQVNSCALALAVKAQLTPPEPEREAASPALEDSAKP